MISPTSDHKDYNRMKYYSALKTQAIDERATIPKFAASDDLQGFLDVPEHML